MKIFICGIDGSGKEKLSKEIIEKYESGIHFDFCDHFVSSFFREQKQKESDDAYGQEKSKYILNFLQKTPNAISDMLSYMIKAAEEEKYKYHIISGIFSPVDFSKLFDPKKDAVIFLNPTDYHSHLSYEESGLSSIRDICFWLASCDILDKSRWIEYNFKKNSTSVEDSGVRERGFKNQVFIVKTFDKVLDHAKDKVGELINAIS